MKVADLIVKYLGRRLPEFGPDSRVPGDWLSTSFGEWDDGHPLYSAHTTNDGYEIVVGYYTKNLIMLRAPEARRLAWFILWTWWARGTWFGLRTAIYMWALRRRLAAHFRRIGLADDGQRRKAR